MRHAPHPVREVANHSVALVGWSQAPSTRSTRRPGCNPGSEATSGAVYKQAGPKLATGAGLASALAGYMSFINRIGTIVRSPMAAVATVAPRKLPRRLRMEDRRGGGDGGCCWW
jgi:hypothetical protein